MNPLIQLKKTTSLLTIALLLAFGVMPLAKGVVPPPDGGYPGFNTAEGQNALFNLTTGAGNTAVGWFSLRTVTVGSFNTATGAGTLFANTADQNTATGAAALLSNTTGSYNTASGAFALFSNTSGVSNTAVGTNALSNNTFGFYNTGVGVSALTTNSTGNLNTAVGYFALGNTDAAGESDTIRIGATQTTAYMAGVYGGTVNNQGAAVLIDTSGNLGTAIGSSRRFKQDIKPMNTASEAVLALKPVSFRYKSDSTNTPQFGLIAEQVADVIPELVMRDKEGKPYSVRYDQVNAMLLNEFLKEHRKNEEQEATIARQQAQIEALTAGLQKVSAQLAAASPSGGGLEASRPAQQMAANNW